MGKSSKISHAVFAVFGLLISVGIAGGAIGGSHQASAAAPPTCSRLQSMTLTNGDLISIKVNWIQSSLRSTDAAPYYVDLLGLDTAGELTVVYDQAYNGVLVHREIKKVSRTYFRPSNSFDGVYKPKSGSDMNVAVKNALGGVLGQRRVANCF